MRVLGVSGVSCVCVCQVCVYVCVRCVCVSGVCVCVCQVCVHVCVRAWLVGSTLSTTHSRGPRSDAFVLRRVGHRDTPGVGGWDERTVTPSHGHPSRPAHRP